MSALPEDIDLNRSLQCAVLDGGATAVVRVVGRGNFSNSMPLKRFAQHVQKGPIQRFIVDLQFCESMDSTFMGVVAGIAITMTQKRLPKLVVFRATDHCKRLLKNLGLYSLVDVRDDAMTEVQQSESNLRPAEPTEITRVDQISLTLQAHRELLRCDPQNEVRFQAVIEYLEKSLTDEGDANRH